MYLCKHILSVKCMTKNNFDLTARQRSDVLQAYREVAPHCHSQEEAYIKTAQHPAPRYYVSPRNAWNRLRLMVTGDFSEVDAMLPNRRRMYYSLFNKLQELSQRRGFIGKSLWFICQFLVAEEAPEFFLTTDAVKRIFIYSKRYGTDYRVKNMSWYKR